HMIGKESMEQAILGGYVNYVEKHHPGAPIPAVFPSEGVFHDAINLRKDLGDEKFFAGLNEGETKWARMEGGWSKKTFEAAIRAPARSEERTKLVETLVKRFFSAVKGANKYVDLDDGLSIVSKHARDLGCDAVVLFLDELILWMSSRVGDADFVGREGPKLAKLVEAQSMDRPVPLVSFVARQRDLKKLIGANTTGAGKDSVSDSLDWLEARFTTIRLEDKNLPAIAEKRVLKPRSEEARQLIDAAFEETARIREEVMNILLTSRWNREMFRKIYPFSPAFMDTLVAMSFLLQRDRTALKVMLQILFDQKDRLRLGEIIPVGDLFDMISEGDEAVSDKVRDSFLNANRLYLEKLKPILERDHKLALKDLKNLEPGDPRAAALRNDDRLVKTLLLAALAPNVEALRGVTASRLAALNHGTIRSPVPGHENRIVLSKARKWAAEVGQIKVGEDPANPTISIQLSEVNTEEIILQARHFDNRGNRIQKIKELIFKEFGISDKKDGPLEHTFVWRGTRRVCRILFENVRTLLNDSLRNEGAGWLVIIDWPFDDKGYGPADDVARIQDFLEETGEGARTLLVIPSFLSGEALQNLGKLVIIDNILTGDNFSGCAGDLSPAKREVARSLLENQQSQLRQRMIQHVENAYGVSASDAKSLDAKHELAPSDHFQTLTPGFDVRPPAGANLNQAFNHLLDQAMAFQYPAHPRFDAEAKLTAGALKKVLAEVEKATRTEDGRLAVEPAMRKIMRRVANPLKIGDMGETHFVLERHWLDHFSKSQAASGAAVTVGALREWMDAPTPMGLPGPLQDLVIMVFAARDDRSFFLDCAPAAPAFGALSDEMALKTVDLPSDEAWEKAIQRGGHIFGVSGSSLLNANNLARFSAGVREHMERCKGDCAALLQELEKVWKERGELSKNAPRLKTAAAAKALLDALAGLEEAPLVERLARWKSGAPGSADAPDAAIGTSLAKAGEVLGVLRGVNWNVFKTVENVDSGRKTEVLGIQQDLHTALEADEHAAPLGGKPSALENKAFKLIEDTIKIVKKKKPPPPEPEGKETLASGEGEFDKEAFEDVARKITAALKKNAGAGVSLKWEVFLL
ncbi:MAG: phage resistance protein, partial [Desulfobacterales bacterium]|nr:phage resistance protein [Desulfobacterales bacterium]